MHMKKNIILTIATLLANIAVNCSFFVPKSSLYQIGALSQYRLLRRAFSTQNDYRKKTNLKNNPLILTEPPIKQNPTYSLTEISKNRTSLTSNNPETPLERILNIDDQTLIEELEKLLSKEIPLMNPQKPTKE
jgi:hypothetical protein